MSANGDGSIDAGKRLTYVDCAIRSEVPRFFDGRLPDLRKVCVFIIGGDPTTRTGARVRHFWEHWFQAAGAIFPRENYRNMVANADEIGCGGAR